jgi:DNA-binding NarL/FixJ family response regulator
MRNSSAQPRKFSVVVCDPCPLIFWGLQRCFESDTRFEIRREVSSLRELHEVAAGGSVDIALVEWCMIGWYDHESIKLVNEISSRALVVVAGLNESTRERKLALEFGVRGIINKRSTPQQIRKALRRVSDGGIWLEKGAAENLLDHVFSPPAGPQDELGRIELLTVREREVIALVCRSLRNKEIASALFISESTVWHHLTSIFGKLKVGDRVSLVTFAFRHNLSSHVDRVPRASKAIAFENRRQRRLASQQPRSLGELSA